MTAGGGFPSIGNIGPLNVVYQPDGKVLADNNDGSIYQFPVNADKQDASVTPISTNYGAGSPSDPCGMSNKTTDF